MKKKEAPINTILNQYLRESRFYCYYELKKPKGSTFNFKNIEEGQDGGLPALEQTGLVWKLSDEDSRTKPCDGMCTPPLPAYLIICFGRTLYCIRYLVIQDMKKRGIKSISEKECFNLSDKVIHI